MPVCPACSKETQAEWKFCRSCGQELPPATVGEFVSSEVIARNIRSSELPGLFNKSLEIQEGQSALLFLN